MLQYGYSPFLSAYKTVIIAISLATIAQMHAEGTTADVQGTQAVTLPMCSAEEFLTVEGDQLVCATPPVQVCPCPDLPLQPPPGCKQFLPPVRGGFVCLRQPAVIYCSVLCDNSSEFSTTPLNPYLCGRPSGSQWIDFTNQTYSQLPQCTGFRHKPRPIHPDMFYLPVPCGDLSAQQRAVLFRDFLSLVLLFGCEDCELEDIFLQCP